MDYTNFLKFILSEYFGDDQKSFCEVTGSTQRQLQGWLSGDVKPQKATINWVMNCIFTPEFRVIAEYADFNPSEKVQTQLKRILKGHEETSGLYAFYDSMANLIYLGKAEKLLQESYAAIRRDVHINMPKGIKSKPEMRYDLVRFVSFYEVHHLEIFDYIDYPKHVESLILRISKPVLNKNIGSLQRACQAKPEGC